MSRRFVSGNPHPGAPLCQGQEKANLLRLYREDTLKKHKAPASEIGTVWERPVHTKYRADPAHLCVSLDNGDLPSSGAHLEVADTCL